MLFECVVCGYIYDESKQAIPFEALSEGWVCPVCESGLTYFKELVQEVIEEVTEEPQMKEITSGGLKQESINLDYLSDFARKEDSVETYMDMIHEMSRTGKMVIEPMRSRLPMVSWEEILIMGAQLSRNVLEEHAPVATTTIIGKKAKRPLLFDHPVFITHMSFGALSKEMKLSLARGSAEVRTAMCSGEGGILPESMDASYKYIFEYVPNKYSVTTENLLKVDAIEIKIGQGTKPGMGGHLPGSKVTEEISKVRNKPMGIDVISPSKFEEIQSKEDLKDLVDSLRDLSDGRPIGIKIAAGHIEEDLEMVAFAGPDFVTIDGRGGGTGASPKLIKDGTTVPTIYALSRARAYLDKHNLDMELIITGGLRVSSDFAKALALGADAIAIGSAAMMSVACQQFKVCNTGKCPVGCATQDQALRKRLNQDHGAMRLANYLKVTLEELKIFARITGHDNVHDLSIDDLATTSHELATYTRIRHV